MTQDCPHCSGTGWIAKDQNGVGVATRCDCVAQKRDQTLIPNAQIPSKYAGCTLDNFVIPQDQESSAAHLRQILGAVRMYAQQFPMLSDPRGILLYGGNGVGKTHLAVAAFRRILSKGFDGRFINYQALLRIVKSSYDEGFGGSRTEDYRLFEEVEVLLLDDVGSNRVTEWVEDTITDLIAQRHDAQRATIVTTNYSPFYVEGSPFPCLADRIGDRATSRLREMCKPLGMPGIRDHRGSKPFGA
jgi:DNA replication protein DnaC